MIQASRAISRADQVHALALEGKGDRDERQRRYLEVGEEKLGFVPNVSRASAFDAAELAAFALRGRAFDCPVR